MPCHLMPAKVGTKLTPQVPPFPSDPRRRPLPGPRLLDDHTLRLVLRWARGSGPATRLAWIQGFTPIVTSSPSFPPFEFTHPPGFPMQSCLHLTFYPSSSFLLFPDLQFLSRLLFKVGGLPRGGGCWLDGSGSLPHSGAGGTPGPCVRPKSIFLLENTIDFFPDSDFGSPGTPRIPDPG